MRGSRQGLGRGTALAAVMAIAMTMGAVGAAYGTPADRYGMGVETFSAEKTSALRNEAFTASARVKNVGAERFPGGQVGAALVDGGGNVAAVVGIFNSFKAVRPEETLDAKMNCSVPGEVAAGRYKLMIVIRAKGDKWKVVSAAARAGSGVATAIEFTVLTEKGEGQSVAATPTLAPAPIPAQIQTATPTPAPAEVQVQAPTPAPAPVQVQAPTHAPAPVQTPAHSSDASPLLRQTIKVDYSVRNSADLVGNQYLGYASQRLSVSTFINDDGGVTVCVSDDNAKTTYIYEFSTNLEERKRLSFPNEFDMLGAFTKDSDGHYYFFYAKEAAAVSVKDAADEVENMAMVKYDKNGKKIKTYKLKPLSTGTFHGVKLPFRSGTCRLEISGSMLAVHFSRTMFDGGDGKHHQASYGFVLNKDTFERVDKGNEWHGSTKGFYASHSFNQFILPIDSGFVFANHGDAAPARAFTFGKFPQNVYPLPLAAFIFPGNKGENATNAEMGGLAKTAGGYIFCGAYGEVQDKPRNLFILTFDDALKTISNPVYLTTYTEKDNRNIGHPKIVAMGSGQYLLLWELYEIFTSEGSSKIRSKYLSTKMQIVDKDGKPLSSAVKDLQGVRLSMNDVLRYNRKNGRVYWAINDPRDPSAPSVTVYALDVQGVPNTFILEEHGTNGDGYGLGVYSLSSDKYAVRQNESFNVEATLINMSADKFPGGQRGAALVDNNGDIVAVIGTKNIGALSSGTRPVNPPVINCTVPNAVPAGQYKLRIAVKADGKEDWRIATWSVDGKVPTTLGFEVK